MRIIIISLLFIFPFYSWGNPVFSSALERTIITSTIESDPQEKRRKSIEQALKNIRPQFNENGELTQTGLQVLTWDGIETQSAEVFSSMRQLQKQTLPLLSEFLNSSIVTQEQQIQVGRPNYARLTKGYKYIYIAESLHNTQSIPEEIIFLLQQIRHKNPQARILLALEFLRSCNHKAPIIFASDPIRFVCLWPVAPFVSSLEHQAETLNIDILGLDDDLSIKTPSEISLKIGEWLVKINYNEPKVQQILSLFPLDSRSSLTEKDALETFLSFHPWGVNNRTRQWAKYIQEISPYYDIIISYGGDGHFTYGWAGLTELPALVNQQGILLNFYTTEYFNSNSKESTLYKKLREYMHTHYGPGYSSFLELPIDDNSSLGKQQETIQQQLQQGNIVTVFEKRPQHRQSMLLHNTTWKTLLNLSSGNISNPTQVKKTKIYLPRL